MFLIDSKGASGHLRGVARCEAARRIEGGLYFLIHHSLAFPFGGNPTLCEFCHT
ncbi:MAG TPA: hypothetical protein VME69_15165 [Methylocella sp.]|nr:hypothetical protein [Methylocella sp.]